MKVMEVWRYPVKSLQGEPVDGADLGTQGIEGDRRFALFDTATGFGLTARRVPELLFAGARLLPDGTAEISLPDGSVLGDDAALSDWLGRPVQLRASDDAGPRRYENPDDFEDEIGGAWEPFDGSTGAFHDSGRAAVSVLSTASIGGWDRRRFRANVIVDEAGEDELVGRTIHVGAAVLDVGLRIPRCVMTTRPQPGGIERDLDVLRRIHREHQGTLAVGALVARPGRIAAGDTVTVDS